jgi:phospholipid/cholesterol/gamma-HCH transport system substrate-binding protein
MKRIPGSAIKFGVFAMASVLVAALMATLIGNLSFTPSNSYSALFTDATDLNPGDPVRLAGVEVGQVQSLALMDVGESRYAKVTFSVNQSVPVYRGAELQLRYVNLIGNRYLAIVESPGSAATLPPGGTFGVDQTKPALSLTALFNGFQPLFAALKPDQVNQLSLEIVQTLQGEGGTLQQLLANTAALATTIANSDTVIGQVIDNLTAVLTTVDQRDSALTSLIGQFRALMSGLATNSDTISTSLPSLSTLLADTSGLISAARPPLAADVGGLNSLAGQLAQTKGTLDQVLQETPSRLNTFTRLADYGSWFNFYLCGADARISLLGQAIQLSTPVGVAANERDTVCAQGGS